MTKQNPQQIEASNPQSSVWVSASAGTGKTKILTDRVLRLLLNGIDPEKILCLTFTNAASNEMKNRINASLIEWKKNPETISLLLEHTPSKKEIEFARELFDRLMLSPDQLSIHTIHSFCQKILQKFPFEAGVEPGFKVLSENETREILDKLIEDIAKKVGQNLDPYSSDRADHASISKSLHYLLQNTHQLSFNELILEIIHSQINFRDLHNKYESAEIYKAYLQKETGIKQDSIIYLQELLKNITKIETDAELTPKENSLITQYNDFLDMDNEYQVKNFAQLKGLFLTLKDEARSILLYKKNQEKYPQLNEKLLLIQKQIIDADAKIKTANMIESTIHVFILSEYVLKEYAKQKRKLVGLDYEDLIYYTKELLSSSAMKDWILYKLDGGISHLLVDEAQDTSPKQWEIIGAIIKEFYSGESSYKDDRSIFVVGDSKQSIYSFQGADVSNFEAVNQYIMQNMQLAEKSFKNIELEYAYRSSKPILSFVSEIFKNNYMKSTEIKCFRESSPGMVEIWPLYEEEKGKKELFWPFVKEMEKSISATEKLAKDIALFIKKYLESDSILPSTNQKVQAGDFMILVRRRNLFTDEIISELKENNIPVAGIDRMLIMNHLATKDIISAAKFAMLPEDDLNLASLLKSPIFGLGESELLKLSGHRHSSLYSSISDQKILDVLEYFIELAKNKSLFDFLYHIINILNVREILQNSCGSDADDVLDELLNLSLDWSRSNSTSIQGFIYWLEKRDIEIKRDIENKNQVRVMTIHGSKGLEAPVIILPDTTSLPNIQNHFLWEGGEYLWTNTNNSTNPTYDKFKHQRQARDYEEYLRLFYVAMTRAEDHLVIAGYKTGVRNIDNSWYDIASKAMKNIDYKEEDKFMYFGDIDNIISKPPKKLPEPELGEVDGSRIKPGMTNEEPETNSEKPRMARNESNNASNNILQHKLPSIEQDYTEVRYQRSPLQERIDISYGIVLHKILEDAVSDKNPDLAQNHPYLKFITEPLQRSITRKVPKLFQQEEFNKILNFPDIRVEASMGYRNDNNEIKFGRMDLLAISDTEIVIVDYKTDKEPPKSSDQINEKYKQQMQNYMNFIKKTHPNHKVSAKILWFENLSLMEVK